MPMSELKCPTARCEPGGEVGIRTRADQIQAVRLRQTNWLKWGLLPHDSEKRARIRQPATRSRFVRSSVSTSLRRRRLLVAGTALVGLRGAQVPRVLSGTLVVCRDRRRTCLRLGPRLGGASVGACRL